MPDGDACFHLRFFELLQRAGLSHSNEAAAKALSGPLEWARRDGAGPLTKQQVGLWRNGKNIPNAETLCALADFFGVSVDYLLGRSSDNVPGYAVQLARHVDAQLLAREQGPYSGPNIFGDDTGVEPARFLRFVVEAAVASQRSDDRERNAMLRPSILTATLEVASQELAKAGKRKWAKLTHDAATDAIAELEVSSKRLFMLRRDEEDAPLPSFAIEVHPGY